MLANNENPQIGQRPSQNQTQQPFIELRAQSYNLPFNISLNLKNSTLTSGLSFKILKTSESLKSFNLLIAWNVGINEFYKQLEEKLHNSLYNREKVFLSECSHSVVQKRLDSTELNDEYFCFNTPNGLADLIEQSKAKSEVLNEYQVVLVLYRDLEDFETLAPNDIVSSIFMILILIYLFDFIFVNKAASFWVVHLKDSKMDTKILYNYLKCANSNVININVSF